MGSCQWGLLILALWLLVPEPALSQDPPFEQLRYSADVSATFAPGAFAHDHDYLIDAAGVLYRVELPGVPERADLDALHFEVNGDVLFSLDVGAVLGGTYFRRSDAISMAGGTFSIAFDAGAAGVPQRANLDALGRRDGKLIVSFDVAFGDLRPADVVEIIDGQIGAKVLDASLLGLSSRLDVDALDALGGTTHMLVSFDTDGTAGNAAFADEDVLQLELATGTWTRRFAPRSASERWAAADLDALASVPSLLFSDGFE